MIRPPCGSWRRITRNASLVHRNAPVRLTSTTAFHSLRSSSSISVAQAPRPALLKSRSTRPYLFTARANRLWTEVGSVTSATPQSMPSSGCSATRAVSGPTRRPATTTVQPSRASATADAAPIPEPPPVTMATRRPSVPASGTLRSSSVTTETLASVPGALGSGSGIRRGGPGRPQQACRSAAGSTWRCSSSRARICSSLIPRSCSRPRNRLARKTACHRPGSDRRTAA